MSARARVRRARRVLMLVAAGRVLVAAVAVTMAALLMALAADRMVGFGHPLRVLVLPAAILAGAMVAVRLGWRMRGLRSLERVGLWLEERLPTHWALVTALDPRYAGDPVLERAATSARDGELLRDTAARAWLPPAGLLLVSAIVLGVLPGPARARIMNPRPGDVLAGPATAPLDAYVVTVEPPAYASLATVTLENPAAIAALEGSEIRIRGRGHGVACGLARGRCRVEGSADGWLALLRMPDSGTVLTLNADTAYRLIAVLPRRDSLPVVLLRSPERDSVLRAPEGRIALAADLHDDFGITAARFEYVISAGVGESFTFRTGVVEGQRGQRGQQGQEGQVMGGVMDIAALGLGPGDVIHLRAVAQDAGPERRGLGVSSTRAIRIAREGEYDTVSTIVLSVLPPDTSALSQRMLIQLTEALVARVPRLPRATVVSESEAISRDQTRLRRLVADVIFMRLGGEAQGEQAEGTEDSQAGRGMTPERMLAAAEMATAEAASGEALDFHGDETPVVAINRPLLEAYNAMWDAGRELNVGEPRRALPHMYRALEAIQRARAAERIYLRGRPRVAVLDVDAVRLSGNRDQAHPGPRGGLEEHGEARRLVERLIKAVGRTDSLLLLRVELLDTHPEAATALGEAIEAMRAGRLPGEALARARAVLAGPAVPGRGRWGGW